MTQDADVIFEGGTILTFNARHERPRALAVGGGRILGLGSVEAVRAHAAPATAHVDLTGRCLMPGFVDAHTHLVGIGARRRLQVDLTSACSLDEMLATLADAAASRDEGVWIMGYGWDESAWEACAYPTRVDLDRSAPRHPVAVTRVDGHFMSVNSKALEAVALEADAPAVDRANGWVRERALGAFEEAFAPPREDLLDALEAEIAHALSLGITGVHEMCDAPSLGLFGELSRRGCLRLRARLAATGMDVDAFARRREELCSDTLSLDALKIVADGSIGARTAALTDAYADGDTAGAMKVCRDDMLRMVRSARKGDLQVIVHAIGDRAITEVLAAFEAAGISPEDRARIEHCELPSEAHLRQMRRMGIVASMQPNFTHWSGPGGMYQRRLGSERDARIDPHRRVLEAGIALAFGSDHMPLGPLCGIHRAVHAPHEAQRIDVAEALRAYTSGSAYAGLAESDTGMLRPGGRADVVVLSGDPLGGDQALDALSVEQTYVAGRKVYGP
jgi:predicted amidohydrolase YtcJ